MYAEMITPDEVERWHSGRLAATGAVRARTAYRLLRAILNKAVQQVLLGVVGTRAVERRQLRPLRLGQQRQV